MVTTLTLRVYTSHARALEELRGMMGGDVIVRYPEMEVEIRRERVLLRAFKTARDAWEQTVGMEFDAVWIEPGVRPDVREAVLERCRSAAVVG